MRLQDLNWMDVERYLEGDSRIILITGATEQHAYLSLFTDIMIPTAIADAAAKREGVLIAPPLNFGVSYSFGDFPGTISLSQRTFDHAVLEIVESLFHHGFRKFLILNGHGGNAVPLRLQDFQMDGIAGVVWYNWWQGAAANQIAQEHGLAIDHANWGENFPFNRVAESPTEIKAPVNADLLLDARYASRSVLGDGSFGGPYQVDDAIMAEIFDAVVDDVCRILKELETRFE